MRVFELLHGTVGYACNIVFDSPCYTVVIGTVYSIGSRVSK
jgi:hypothetical protein